MKLKKVDWDKVLFWTTRGLGIAFIIFLSLFAIDSEDILGLLIHLIPSFILIGFLVVAWKKQLLGSVLFFILGIAFTVFFNTYRSVLTLLFISLPVFLVSGLFYLEYYRKKK
jgi:hypothetical protein